MKNKPRTYARNRVLNRRGQEKINESDGVYFLKLVLVILLGSLWLKFKTPFTLMGVPFYGAPLGLVLGILLVRGFEKYQFDRKIWYALLVLVTIVSYFLPSGIVL